MGARKISVGPYYEKTGSPTRKQKEEMTRLQTQIFAEIFSQKTKNKRPQKSGGASQASTEGAVDMRDF
jgi:hypothetical protein